MLSRIIRVGSKNFAFAFVFLIVNSLAGFLATPIIIHAIGKTDFGIYHLILQFIAYLAVCELGLATPSLNILNEAWQKQDRNLVQSSLRILIKEYFRLVPVVLITLLGITFIFFTFIIVEDRGDVLPAFLLMSGTALFIPFHVFRNFINAAEQAHLVSKISSVQLLLMTGLNIVLSIKGFGLVGLAISFIGCTALYHFAMFFIARRLISSLPDKKEEAQIDRKQIWHVSFHGFFQEVLLRLSHSSDAIVLSFFAPPAMLTNFVTNQKTAILMDSILKTIGNSTWATISRLKDEKRELQRVMNVFHLFFPLVSHPMAFALAYNNHDFVNLWLGPGFFLTEAFTWIIFANFCVFVVLAFWGWLFVAFGKVPTMTNVIIYSGLINVGLSFGLAYFLGFIGPVLGTFISFYGYYIWHMRVVMKRELSIDVSSYIFNSLKLIVVLGILYIGLNQISLFKGDNWLGLLLNMAIVYVLALGISLLALMRKRNIGEIKVLLRTRD